MTTFLVDHCIRTVKGRVEGHRRNRVDPYHTQPEKCYGVAKAGMNDCAAADPAAQTGAAFYLHLLWGSMLLVTLAHGPGKLSIDQLVGRLFGRG